MTRLFGIPTGGLTLVLVALLVVALSVVLALGLRNPIFLRLGIRNVRRRRARTFLIVAGLMLGTAIIAAALATGDTMSQTIRSSATSALGATDEVVAAKGVEESLAAQSAGTASRYFPQSYADGIAAATRSTGLVDGVAPVIVEQVAALDASNRQNEPRVTLFAADPARLRGFGEIRSDGETVSLASLRRGEVFLNAEGADKLDAKAGDTVRLLAGRSAGTARVRAIVRYDGGGTDGAGVLMPLAAAQQLLKKPGLVKAVFVSNTGGAGATDAVMRVLKPVVTPLGLEADNTKQDALETADEAGSVFMSFFTTFGSFSIASGILLIFLIFVMLAAERRGELGIARAVGTRRRHLVQMFLYEGMAYDLAAALVGALVGIAVAYGMVLALARAFATADDFRISYSVKPTSFVLAYAIGVLLTLVVVAFSAWRVSRMNIVAAIRNLPEEPSEKRRRRRWLLGIAGLLVGGALASSGVSSEDAVVLGLGISIVILSLVPILRLFGLPDRAVRTAAGLALIAWFVLPFDRWILAQPKVNFGIFVLGGLMIVVGASWTLMYNADVLLGTLGAATRRMRGLAPVLKMSMAYPLRSLFRTGVTLAMFTLVVFTLVVGATTSAAFANAFNDKDAFGGGFDVRATGSPAAPIADMRSALTRAPGLQQSEFRLVSSISTLAVKARQLGTGMKEASYVVHGADAAFLQNTSYKLAAWARGYSSTDAVWNAIRTQPNLAVVDQFVVPRRENWNFGMTPDFKLKGFYLEDKSFDPVRVSVRDQQTGKRLTLTVIGVLSDSTPEFMGGMWTSQITLGGTFGDRVLPTTYLFAVRPGIDPKAAAAKIESAFLANGVEADSLEKLLSNAVSATRTMNRLVMGFMGLGLIVGVAALGVISARAVVERRQHIGVLRAIGFRRRMVQLSFLLESSFVALTAILVGTGLGLVVAHNVIDNARRQPSWENLGFDVPWASLGAIFLLVYLVALATTFAPAVRASRVYPAEALRYQ
jgi:putative ABC transport system permease protein